MASLSQKFKTGFGKHYTTDEKIKTGIRAVVAIVPLIVFSVLSDRDFKYLLTLKSYLASNFRTASIVTAAVFFCVVVFNTIADQIRTDFRNDKQKNAHRIATLVFFGLVVSAIKVLFCIVGGGTAIFFLPELIEIVALGLLLYLCNMKQG